jgi:FkbM family methyltransferase
MISSYLFENKYIGVKRAKRGIFMFNRNDLFIGRSLDLYGEWCESELLLLGNYIRESDVVLDVGANIGTHTIAFAEMVGRTGRVHAFEPQSSLFHLLCGNIALNCLDNVRAYRKAVGSGDGEIKLPELPAPNTPFNYGAVSLSMPCGGEKVELVPLDSLDLTSCRLIKIDVEGMELEVLEGAKKTVEKLQPLLFVENNTIDQSPRLIDGIFRLGYRAYWQVSPYFSEYNFFGNTENVFSKYRPEANLICVPKTTTLDMLDLIECTSAEDNWKKVVERLARSN